MYMFDQIIELKEEIELNPTCVLVYFIEYLPSFVSGRVGVSRVGGVTGQGCHGSQGCHRGL